MSKAVFNRLKESLYEAAAISAGEMPAARIRMNGHNYVPENRWQPIETAPIACTVLAAYFNPIYGEWVVEIVVAERAKAPFTHWQIITNPDEAK